MNQKVSRNDPCPCGSGKKYKSCCLSKETTTHPSQPRSLAGRCKVTVKQKEMTTPPNLMDRTFGAMIASDEAFKPVDNKNTPK